MRGRANSNFRHADNSVHSSELSDGFDQRVAVVKIDRQSMISDLQPRRFRALVCNQGHESRFPSRTNGGNGIAAGSENKNSFGMHGRYLELKSNLRACLSVVVKPATG